MEKKTIQPEFKNTPTGAPPAGCSVSTQLTSPQRDSVAHKAGLYPAEVDQRDGQPEQDRKVPAANAHVFVLDANGIPLMPCKPQRARKLLKRGKAKVISARPFFMIQLTKHVGGATQTITLGVDTGYEYIGFALVGSTCHFVGQLKLDNKMSKRLQDRAMYRRNRRNRLRYRPARWKNRANQRNKDLPPSVQRRIDRHIWLIEKLKSLCPVSSLVIEGASFDIQKLKNPDIQGKEYQEGPLHRSNLRNYLFVRENGCCQYCGKKIKLGERVEIHHILQRSRGGTDKSDNLALLHDKCHEKLHREGLKLKPNKQYKAETSINVLRKRLFEKFPEAVETFGYETSSKRKQLDLDKDHYIDAFVIAGGMTQDIPKPLKFVEHRRNNRSLQIQKPGKQIAIRRQRYSIQPGDIVWVGSKKYVSKGSSSYGKQIWIMKSGKKVGVSINKITKIYHSGSICIEP